MAQTQAILDGFTLPFNPNSVEWGYHLNTATFDTLGGRVIQLLSANVESMQFKADAGSADNLIAISQKIAAVMSKHSATQQPVRLEVPTKGWVFEVYATSMPGIGWAVETVTYPYQVTFEVHEDYNTLQETILGQELERMARNIGYDPTKHGGTVPHTPEQIREMLRSAGDTTV